MIALPQCYSTSLRWRGALHIIGLEESVSIETTTTVAHGVGGDWANVFFLLEDNDTRVHWHWAAIESVKQGY